MGTNASSTGFLWFLVDDDRDKDFPKVA